MHKITARFLVLFLFLNAFALAAAAPARADDKYTKLGRGAGNVLFGPLEIPYQMGEIAKSERWPIAFFGGLAKGTVYGIRRMGVGLYEIFTFPWGGKTHYGPIIEPEFIIPART